MDALSDILDTVRFRGVLYFTTHLTTPFGIRVPDYRNVVRFHLVSGGNCWVAVAGVSEPMLLEPGDLIIIPHGASHTLSDRPDARVLELDSVLEQSGFAGKGALVYGGADDSSPARLVCGHFEFDERFDHPILGELPPHILMKRAQAVGFSWFDDALKFTTYEAGTERLGYDAIIQRLTEILFVHMVRFWSESDGGEIGFVSAVNDRGIGRSLNAFHARPGDKWRLEDLAREAGLSRTVFAERFKALTGRSPMHYVTEWRLQKAKRLLGDTGASMDWVAAQVGYDSVAAFGRVFKKQLGVGPGRYRAQQKAAA